MDNLYDFIRTTPPPRHRIDVVVGRQFRRERIEVVSVPSHAVQQNHWPAGAAPIEDFELDALLHGDGLNPMR